MGEIDLSKIDAITNSLERAEQAKKGKLNLKKADLLKAIKRGEINVHSLSVCECGERICFFYKDTLKAFLLDTKGQIKRFKKPAREIEIIKERLA